MLEKPRHGASCKKQMLNVSLRFPCRMFYYFALLSLAVFFPRILCCHYSGTRSDGK
ncbi:hypothetical protein B0H12DRAFT_1167651 [Mycena haematopus]|nr:hypothetical protein B0H12DRAFT_1167651 [Mycena haematopus]